MKVYIDTNDWWIGYYRGDTHHYVCPLPCVVIRWNRRSRDTAEGGPYGFVPPYPVDLYGPGCPCSACATQDESLEMLTFRQVMPLCPECGNKRCPGAADHRNRCTASNEPGQPGSLYPATLPGSREVQQ